MLTNNSLLIATLNQKQGYPEYKVTIFLLYYNITPLPYVTCNIWISQQRISTPRSFFLTADLFHYVAADFCRVGSGASFQPIRSQIPIPTAHVMPSTASEPHLRALEEPQASAELHRTSSASRTSSSSSSNSKSSSLSKSASSPNLDVQGGGSGGGGGGGDPAGPKPDCLSRFRSLVNGLDHSLFPSGEHTRFDESQRFDTPSVEPTLNQTALTGGMCPDGRLRVQSHGRGTEAYKGSLENSYKALPEARSEACRAGQAGAAGPAGLYPGSLGPLQAQALQREHAAAAAAAANAYEAQSLQDACSALSSCHQQQQHKQQLESLRLQVEQMQVSARRLGL